MAEGAGARLLAELEAGGELGPRLAALEGASTGFARCHAVSVEALPRIAEVFARAGYFLEMLTCLDLRQHEGRMRLVYTFNCFAAADRWRLHADLAATRPWSGPAAKPPRAKKGAAAPVESGGGAGAADARPLPIEAPSLAGSYPAANWLEREVFDMFGLRFAGHPQLERLLLPEDADFHPLLKDFGRIDAAPAGAAARAGGADG